MTTATNWRATAAATPRGKRGRKIGPAWLLVPSVILLSIFVYLFIGVVGYTSLSNWQVSGAPDLSLAKPLGSTYKQLFTDFQFQSDLRNIVVFVVLILICVTVLGMGSALALYHLTVGRNTLRSIMLLPYSLSFIVTGTVWRWIFSPGTGVNQILEHLGMKNPPLWASDSTVIPGLTLPGSSVQIQLGIPVAILPLVFAAAWQLYGYSMAIYLAGLSSIGTETIEAASVDGASRFRTIRSVIIPQLRSSTVTNVVIMFGVAIQIFDLVVSMTGAGAAYSTDMPSLFIYNYFGSSYNVSAAASFVLLLITMAVMLPYLILNYRKPKGR